jgi:uncharacterized DUF497 family protein
MADVQFTWDPAKAATNLRKHGVSFEDASTVFRNSLAQVLPDPTHSEQEQRLLIIGHSAGGRVPDIGVGEHLLAERHRRSASARPQVDASAKEPAFSKGRADHALKLTSGTGGMDVDCRRG